jgi:hypothetical protein
MSLLICRDRYHWRTLNISNLDYIQREPLRVLYNHFHTAISNIEQRHSIAALQPFDKNL